MNNLTMVYVLLSVFSLSGIPAVAQVTLGHPEAIVLDMDVDQERKVLAANMGDAIEIWNFEKKELIRRIPANRIIAIARSGQKLVGSSADGKVYVWDMESGATLLEKSIGNLPIISAVWINADMFAISSEERMLMTVSASTGDVKMQLPVKSVVTALELGASNTIIAGDEKGIIKLYEASHLTEIKTQKDHNKRIRAIAVADSSRNFVTAADDHRIVRRNSTASGNVLYKTYGGAWPICVDYVEYSRNRSNAVAIGRLNGRIEIRIAASTYVARVNATINRISLLTDSHGYVSVAIATHGKGIQIINAVDMAIRTN